MEKLLTIAPCTTNKEKAGANAQRPTPGWVLLFLKKVHIKDLFNFLNGCLLIISI